MRQLQLPITLIVILWQITARYCEPLTFFAVGIAGAGIIYGGGKAYCKLRECCEASWINHNINGIDKQFRERLFGQHLVRDVVPALIKAHRQDRNPVKPMVLAFHGSTGTGKNFVSDIIAEQLYYKGVQSEYVHKFLCSHLFPNKDLVGDYRIMIRERLTDVIKRCDSPLFIIDEFDKMPPGLIDTFKPFLDYNDKVEGYDFRKAIFIFMGNTGVEEINEVAFSFFKEGKNREEITLKSMVKLLRSVAYESGGMAKAMLLENHLINVHVPFLPLERQHIRSCAHVELTEAHKTVSAARLDKVADELEYFPKGHNIYSVSGCKNDKTHVQLLKHK